MFFNALGHLALLAETPESRATKLHTRGVIGSIPIPPTIDFPVELTRDRAAACGNQTALSKSIIL